MVKMSDVMMRLGASGSLLLAGLAMSACAVDGAPADEPTNDPIAEVSLENGTKVTFFEPVQGAIAIGQETALGVAPVVTEGLSAVEVYRSIAPGKAVPGRLLEAQARADVSRADRPVRSAVKPAPGASTASFSSSWFENTYCYNGGGYTFINCHASPLASSNLSGTHSDVDEFFVTECTNTGHVTLSVWVEDDKRLGVQLNAGHCYSYHWSSGIWNADYFKVTTVITQAPATYGLAVKWNH